MIDKLENRLVSRWTANKYVSNPCAPQILIDVIERSPAPNLFADVIIPGDALKPQALVEWKFEAVFLPTL